MWLTYVHAGCVILYQNSGCTGQSVQVFPGRGAHNNLKKPAPGPRYVDKPCHQLERSNFRLIIALNRAFHFWGPIWYHQVIDSTNQKPTYHKPFSNHVHFNPSEARNVMSV
uniref:Uncharacterized protein n=1 Tax=Cacopsylla melanoneura TaxID=428564 RepID=A0A8D9AVC1_9HEMI